METQANVEVHVLSGTDSWELFRQKAGHVLDSEALYAVSKEIIDECYGLPLAIVTVAKALRNKDIRVWVDAAQQLRKSNYDSMSAVITSIKFSYDKLEGINSKLCFFLCSLFPEDSTISMDRLLGYVIGEDLFDDADTIDEVRNRLHSVVDKLFASSLLLRGENDGDVMMHDIVRDVDVSISADEHNRSIIKAGLGLQRWPKLKTMGSCLRVSLNKNRLSELPDQPECSQLLTLSLAYNYKLTGVPGTFFNAMKGLVTLDLSNTGISSLPQSLSGQKNRRTLLLRNCYSLEDVAIIGHLSKLEVLNLEGTRIQWLPQEMCRLTNLKLLDISNLLCPIGVAPNAISSLFSLDELRLNCNDVLMEAASLSNLTTLHLSTCNDEEIQWLSRDIGSSILISE